MTAPDLTAIVEVAAEAEHERRCERTRQEYIGKGYDAPDMMTWPELTERTRMMTRRQVTPIVRATLTALMPLADGWEEWARSNERQGDELLETLDDTGSQADRNYALTASQRAYTARDVHNSCAKALRGVMAS